MTAWGVILPLMWAAVDARADEPPDEAQALQEHGAEQAALGHHESAYRAFEDAYQLSKDPALLERMAAALEGMERWKEALDLLVTYRPYAPDAERSALEARVRALQERIELPEREVRARSGPDPVVMSLVGLGAVGVGTGTFFGLRTQGARGEWQGMCREGLCPASAEPWVRRDQAGRPVTDVAWGLGLTAVGSGVILAWLQSGRAAEATGFTLQVVPGGVRVGGRW